MKKAFTLAEILIVLTCIGIMTAVLMPAAFQASPDEDVMKFKKAHSTLGTVIRELVQSDKYYKEGNMAKKPDGTTITDKTYFCKTIAEILSVKEQACIDGANGSGTAYIDLHASTYSDKVCTTYTSGVCTAGAKKNLDDYCAAATVTIKKELVTPDGVYWYQTRPDTTFGNSVLDWENAGVKKDGNGFVSSYKVFCIDVDGDGATAPFGYGIRSDGKILTGARADEWIKKSVQKGN